MMKTRTAVHSRLAQRKERVRSEAAALRALACVQLGAQMILWITFFGYDRAAQAVWQAALMWGLPFFLLWFVWKKAALSLNSREAQRVLLVLLPCLMLDAAFLLFALGGFIGQLIPQYPGWAGVWAAGGFAFLAAYLPRRRGVAYGADVFKWLLAVLFVFATLFLRNSSRGDRLWPILGRGLANTAQTALSGAGSLWGMALLFALPKKADQKAVCWGLIPWAAACIWALWYGFLRPWGPEDVLPVAEKMMGFARHAASVTLYEMAGLMWLLLLPLALTGALSTGETLLSNAFPTCPRIVPLLCVLLPGMLGMLLTPGRVIGFLDAALPWRLLISLGAGIGILSLGRKGRKA